MPLAASQPGRSRSIQLSRVSPKCSTSYLAHHEAPLSLARVKALAV